MAKTASFDHKAPFFSTETLLVPFNAIGRFFTFMAESSTRFKALERLSQMSDADLEARGLTRDAEIRRIMGVSLLP